MYIQRDQWVATARAAGNFLTDIDLAGKSNAFTDRILSIHTSIVITIWSTTLGTKLGYVDLIVDSFLTLCLGSR